MSRVDVLDLMLDVCDKSEEGEGWDGGIQWTNLILYFKDESAFELMTENYDDEDDVSISTGWLDMYGEIEWDF